MLAENISDSTTTRGDASDVSEDIADLLASISAPKSTGAPDPSMQDRGGGAINNRKHHRHPVRWRIALVNKGDGKNDIYHGRTYDVSMSGINVLLEHNVFFTSEVVVLLAIPPTLPGQKETIVEIQCNIMHTVLDSEHKQFRLGMKFVQFKRDGKRILSDILSKRHIPKSEPSPYVAMQA